MNKDEKKALEKIVNILETQMDYLMDLCEIENDKYENMNEDLQATELGQRINENSNSLEYNANSLDSIIDELRNLIDEN